MIVARKFFIAIIIILKLILSYGYRLLTKKLKKRRAQCGN